MVPLDSWLSFLNAIFFKFFMILGKGLVNASKAVSPIECDGETLYASACVFLACCHCTYDFVLSLTMPKLPVMFQISLDCLHSCALDKFKMRLRLRNKQG